MSLFLQTIQGTEMSCLIVSLMLNKSNFVTRRFPGLVITEMRNNSFNTVSVNNTFFIGMSLVTLSHLLLKVVYVLFVSILKALAGNNDLFYNSRPNQLIFSSNF